MNFKYSICHPEKEEIEYRNEPKSGKEILKIAENYPWIEKLKFTDLLNPEEIIYSPSLDFVCIENGRSFCLTADYDENKNLIFSLWYNRPKKVKVLFGFLNSTERMIVDDINGFSLKESLNYLEYFVNGNYSLIERLYEK